MENGNFIISLDFELHWGGAEKWDLSNKKDYFLQCRDSIPKVLELFEKNNIRATWATVGFLFAKDKKQLIEFLPNEKPTYLNKSLCYYDYFDQVGDNEYVDPFHFAYQLIKQIIATKGQELSTHTFSHYYCNEPGQTIQQFDADLNAAQSIAKENFGVNLQSLVFPRNQFNKDYTEVAKKYGIKVLRVNPDVWFWNKNYGKLTPFFRALDTLIPISKALSFKTSFVENGIVHLPASRFFRPFKESEKRIQNLKMTRIKNEMKYAAKNGENYHLWWHPHNFGDDVQNNLKQLEEIILYFNELKLKYNFKSANMLDFICFNHN